MNVSTDGDGDFAMCKEGVVRIVDAKYLMFHHILMVMLYGGLVFCSVQSATVTQQTGRQTDNGHIETKTVTKSNTKVEGNRDARI